MWLYRFLGLSASVNQARMACGSLCQYPKTFCQRSYCQAMPQTREFRPRTIAVSSNSALDAVFLLPLSPVRTCAAPFPLSVLPLPESQLNFDAARPAERILEYDCFSEMNEHGSDEAFTVQLAQLLILCEYQAFFVFPSNFGALHFLPSPRLASCRD